MTRTYNICLLPGDGIGPEIIAEGVKVLDAVGAKYDTCLLYTSPSPRDRQKSRMPSSA